MPSSPKGKSTSRREALPIPSLCTDNATTALTAIWDKVNARLREMTSDDVYGTYLAGLRFKSLENGVLFLTSDNQFMADWVNDNYGKDLHKAALLSGVECSECRVVASDCAEAPRPAPARGHQRAARRPAEQRTKAESANLKPEYTFESFVRGRCNDFPYAAALGAAQHPGGKFNPLFIYGETAMGKTHLMQAIGHEIERTLPAARVCYVTCEQLLNDFYDSLSRKTTVEFRSRYRGYDVLLVDDIQFIVGKNQLQEEFFNLFNALHNAKRQIVITSDRAPNELQGLEQRLVSRFGWGLVTSIDKPDFETRMAILRYKQSQHELKLGDELLNFIAENVTSNIRNLEGALTKAVVYASAMGVTLTVDALRKILVDVLDPSVQATLSANTIQSTVAELFDIPLSAMTSKCRQASLATPRQIAMLICYQYTTLSYPEIGAVFGKTHATVIHACKAVQDRMDVDAEFAARVNAVVRKLGRDPAQLRAKRG